MDSETKMQFECLESGDKESQMEAFSKLFAKTDEPVVWAYEVWDDLVSWLTDSDNHRRSRGAQLLSGLAKSDPDGRIVRDFPAIWQVTKDEKFVTLRHSMQAVWKVGLAGDAERELVIKHMKERFIKPNHKNATLIRYDIIVGMKHLYEKTGREDVKRTALKLIEAEDDVRYRKKYAGVWK